MKNKKGSSLAVVIILTMCIGWIIVSVLNYAAEEKRLNHRQYMTMKADYAAEAGLNSAVNQINKVFADNDNVPIDTMTKTGTHPVRLPDSYFNLFADDSNSVGTDQCWIDLPVKPTDPTSVPDYGVNPTEVLASSIQPINNYYIDPVLEPNNQFKGMMLNSYKLVVFGRARTYTKMDISYTSTAAADIYINDVPLFCFFAFYNMDMEVHPGPDMTINGKIHSNGNLYYSTGANLTVLDTLIAYGKIIRGHKDKAYSRSDGTTPSYFRYDNNDAHTRTDFLNGHFIFDPANSNYKSDMNNQWNGWTQDQANSVAMDKLTGTDPYKSGDTNNDGKMEQKSYNPGYQLIMPLKSVAPATEKDKAIEKQKFSYKAGLTIKVNSDNTYSINTYSRDANKDVVYTASAPTKVSLGNPSGATTAGVLTPVVAIKPYGVAGGGLVDMRRNINSGGGGAGSNGNLNTVEVDVGLLKSAVESAANYTDTANYPNAKKVLATWGVDTTSAVTIETSPSNPKNWWTGVVYVELPLASPDPNRSDGVVPSVDNYGVVLKNGGQIPDPSWCDTRGINHGTTIATNTPLYVQGTYNADGQKNVNNGPGGPIDNTTDPDYLPALKENGTQLSVNGAPQYSKEPPAALAADAVTFLSNNWKNIPFKLQSLSYGNRTVPAQSGNNLALEVSAAVVAGIVPSQKLDPTKYNTSLYDGYSGGLENFPRFLENWNSVEFYYRGSLNCMFESEVAVQPWLYGNNIYGAPTRRWGFNALFAGDNSTGTPAKYPPGMPYVRALTKKNMELLTFNEFKAKINKLETFAPALMPPGTSAKYTNADRKVGPISNGQTGLTGRGF